jgi:putative ABC transport system permease protein
MRERRRARAGARRFEPFVRGLRADIRYSLRIIAQQPGFAISAMATCAMAVGVAAPVATLAHAVLVRPLPYAEPERLVHLFETRADRPGRQGTLSYSDFTHLEDASRTFEMFAGYSGGSRTLTGESLPERVPSTEVTADFFQTLGAVPLLGRPFAPADTFSGSEPAVILSHGAWQRRFGGRHDVIGRQVALNTVPHTVVGVLPATFEFPLRGMTDLWLPLRLSQAQRERGYWHWLDVIGRLRPGVAPAQGLEDLASISRSLAVADPRWHSDSRFGFIPLRQRIAGTIRPALAVVLAGVLLVALGACASVAGLFIARWGARTREMGIRAALGARPRRLVRQLLTESLLLTLGGCLIGLLAGRWLLAAFVASLPPQHRHSLPHLDALRLDGALAFGVAASTILAGLAASLFPALAIARTDPAARLRGAGRASHAGQGRRRTALVTIQVALAAVLLLGAVMLGRSTWHLLRVSPGFDPANLLTMKINLSGERYRTRESVRAFHAELLERISRLPGAAGAATIDSLPLTGRGNTGTVLFAGEPPSPSDGERLVAIRAVSASYFNVLGVPLLRGRLFTSRDDERSTRVALVNQTFAEGLGAGPDLLGRRIQFEFFAGKPYWEIVGVVGDEHFEALDRPPMPVVYFPFQQNTGGEFGVILRTARDPGLSATAARSAVAELDPGIPLFLVRPMEQIIRESDAVFVRWNVLALLTLFAAAALIVSATGLYGVLAQIVAQQTQEIGVRVALGATAADIRRLLLVRGLVPAVLGLSAGLLLAASVSQMFASLLFEVPPLDGLSMAAVALVLLLTSMAAWIVPAFRAVRVDPVAVLRPE